MATLKIHDLGASYGERTLFAGLNLVVSGNQKVGLSGPNGAGKSTRLAILAGVADPAVVVDGSFELSPADASIGYLTQEVERGEESAAEFIQRDTGVRDATASMDELAEALGNAENALKKAPDNDKTLRNSSAARSEKQAGKIAQSERAIERLTEVPEPRKEWVLHLELPDAPRSGQVVSVLHDEVVQLGEKTFGPWTVQLNYGDRVLIRGANGAGKTTLVRALCREENLGSAVVLGSIDQLRGLLDQDVDLMTVFSTYVPAFEDAELHTLLAKFGLVKSQVNGRATRSLSPGERTRALMALLQATPTNFLVLDEPTNHLDVAAIEELERALQDYRGTVLLVSHDRRMVDSFRATRVLTVVDGKIVESFPDH